MRFDITLIGTALLASALVVGCNSNNSSRNRDLKQEGTTKTEQVTQSPGRIAETTERDHANVEVKKEIVDTTRRVETEKESIPTVAITQHKADINRMDSKDFMAMGLSKDAADRVVKYRKDHGDFKSMNDLSQVPGISASWLNTNRDKLGLSQG
jgi:DNA uptake protein ComE-like DNA-binding protein